MADQLARTDVPVEHTWDLTDLFPDRAAWDAEREAVRGAVGGLAAYQGRVGESAETLRAALEADEALLARLQRVFAYASLGYAVEQSEPERQADAARAQQLASEVGRGRTFLDDEISALDLATVEAYLAAEPGLEPYARRIERILRDKPHRLSSETEQVLASFGEAFQTPFNVYQRATGADVDFPPATDSRGEEYAVTLGRHMFTFSPSPDTTLRRAAYTSLADGLTPYRNTLAATLAARVRNAVIEARVRGFASAIDMDLHGQEVTHPAFDALIDGISTGLAPHMQRFARLQQRVLGVERTRIADIGASWPGDEPELSYEQAHRLILEATEPMGAEYRQVMDDALSRRWVDRADNAGRRGGAFCSSVYGVHPYVFATWTGNLRGAYILAHELGHAVQGQLSMRNNPLGRARPSLYAIEAPSTFNELLLAQRLLAESDDERYRRRVIKALMATFHRNFVVHLQKAQLQRSIYALAEEGGVITADVLDRTSTAILEAFWGDSVELVPEDRTIWMHEAHYYMGMYPYTYSAGLTAAVAAFGMLEREGGAAAERWIRFLKAGGSKDPVALFADVGIDMTDARTVQHAIDHVGALVDRLEGEAPARA